MGNVDGRLLRYSNLIFMLAMVCIFLSWLIPNHYFPWSSFYNDFFAAISLWLLFFGVVARNKSCNIPAGIFWLFIIALIPLAQFLFGIIVFAGDALITLAYLVGFAVAVLVGKQLAYSNHHVLFLAVAGCFVCGATLSSFIALYQWFGLSQWGSWVADMPPGGRPFANLGQPNNFAILECLGLVSVLYLWERKALGKIVSILIAGLLLVGVVLSQSRTPWAISFIFIAWWLWKRKEINLQLKVGAIVVCIAVYGLLLYTLPLINEWSGLSLTEGLQKRALEVDGARGVIWLQLWDAVWQGPIWGYGWNQVGLAQTLVVGDYPSLIYAGHSHNFFLDLLIWNGPVLGAVLVLSIVYWGMRNAFICRSKEGWYGLACIAFLLVHGMLEYPLEYAYFLFPLGLIVGSVWSQGKELKTISVSRWSMASVLVLGAGMLSVVFVEYSIVEADGRLMRFEAARIGNLRAENKAPDVIFLTQLREYHRFVRTEATSDMTEDKIAWMEKVAHRYANPPALFRYALALFLNNRADEGEVELIRLRQLYGVKRYTKAVNDILLLSQRYPQLEGIHL